MQTLRKSTRKRRESILPAVQSVSPICEQSEVAQSTMTSENNVSKKPRRMSQDKYQTNDSTVRELNEMGNTTPGTRDSE